MRPPAPLIRRAFALAALLGAAVGCEPSRSTPLATRAAPLGRAFAAGSLIVPMDTTYQDEGALEAVGLVLALLREDVPVQWAIAAGKAQDGVDFTATATDLATGAAVPAHGYRGGAFVIDLPQRARALPRILTWQAEHPATTVHAAAQPFDAPVRVTLASAPRLAVLQDGSEAFVFAALNAAGVPDSAGQPWPTATALNYPGAPDVLTSAQLRGDAGTVGDGALLSPEGTPRFCHLTAANYLTLGDDGLLRELHAWLAAGPLTHAFFGATGAVVLEGDGEGRFLTTGGLVDDGYAPSQVRARAADAPGAQYDGTLAVGGGYGTDVYGLAEGSTLRGGAVALIGDADEGQDDARMVLLSGPEGGNAAHGRVSYLAGAGYLGMDGGAPVARLPISAHPATNGVRLFLEGLLASGCAAAENQPAPVVTMAGPPPSRAPSLTFTVAYQNPGPGVAEEAVLSVALPPGVILEDASAASTARSGGVVLWNLGTLAPGEAGSAQFSVAMYADATFTLQAQLAFRVGETARTVGSAPVQGTLDTTPPDTELSAAPATQSNVVSPSFAFTSTESPAAFECQLDGAGFVACDSPVTLPALADGLHRLEVRAIDAAANVDPSPASWSWTVDTLAPETVLTGQPPSLSHQGTATFTFGSSEPGSTFECRLDGAPSFVACSAYAVAGLTDGPHVFAVRARDAAGNVDITCALSAWTVDTLPPRAPEVNALAEAEAFTSGSITLTGIAEAGATVLLFVDGLEACTTTAAASGSWSCTLSPTDGEHVLSVSARDAAGNPGPSTAPVRFAVGDGSTMASSLGGGYAARGGGFGGCSTSAAPGPVLPLTGLLFLLGRARSRRGRPLPAPEPR